MKSIRTTLIAASLLASLSGLTLAQTAPEAKHHAHRAEHTGKMHANMAERHTKHLSDLKGKLKLEANQASAWTAFEQAMQAPAQPMAHSDQAAMEKMTTPERIDHMQAHKGQRDAQMQKHANATKTFYAALNDAQKKVFDAETARMMKSRGHGMHGGQEHGGHHGQH